MTARTPTTCVVGDSSTIYADGLARALTARGFHVAAVVDRPEQVAAAAVEAGADVVIVGFAPAVSSRVVQACSSMPVVVTAWSERGDDIVDVLRAGARAFVGKDGAANEIADAVRRVIAGEMVLPSAAARSLLRGLDRETTPRHRAGDVGLTGRDRDLLALLAEGYSNKEIAVALGLATQTVKNHAHRLSVKLGVASRMQLCAYAIDHRIRSPRHVPPGQRSLSA